jgi:hypothetical protein
VTDIPETLLLEVHRAIETAAKEAVSKLGRPLNSPPLSDHASPLAQSVASFKASLVAYPPADSSGGPLSPGETTALAGMVLSPEARAGLEKLFADAAAAAFFRFFCLLDGVGNPDLQPVDDWLGAVLTAPPDDEDRPMLHDAFFDTYWRYREISHAAR